MIDWLSQRINKIRKIEKYSKPVKNASFKLDANENLLLDSNFLSQLVIKEARKIDLRKYPLELYDELYRKLSEYLKVSEKTLVIGNGSDQIIELLLSVIGEHKRVTLFTQHFLISLVVVNFMVLVFQIYHFAPRIIQSGKD